jgi:hypothetical protein
LLIEITGTEAFLCGAIGALTYAITISFWENPPMNVLRAIRDYLIRVVKFLCRR